MPQPSAPPSSTSRGPRIAIIGGGTSGLSAAHRLNEILPGAELELFEHSGRLGGVLNTVERGGFLIEQSADNFLVKPSAGLDLCRKLGLADQLLTTDETRRRAFIVRRGRLIPIPDGFYLMSPRKLWPVLTSPALSLAGKLRLLAEPFVPRRLYAPGDAQGHSGLARVRRKRRLFRPSTARARSLRTNRATTRRRHLHGRSRATQHGRHDATIRGVRTFRRQLTSSNTLQE